MELLHEDLTGIIRQTAYESHCYFGTGFLEKVYVNSLANRLRKKGLRVEKEHAIAVRDEDGTIVGEYFADLIVNDTVVVEAKALSALTNEHAVQVLNYLKATEKEVGVLINFGSEKFQFKRFVRSKPSASSANSADTLKSGHME